MVINPARNLHRSKYVTIFFSAHFLKAKGSDSQIRRSLYIVLCTEFWRNFHSRLWWRLHHHNAKFIRACVLSPFSGFLNIGLGLAMGCTDSTWSNSEFTTPCMRWGFCFYFIPDLQWNGLYASSDVI